MSGSLPTAKLTTEPRGISFSLRATWLRASSGSWVGRARRRVCMRVSVRVRVCLQAGEGWPVRPPTAGAGSTAKPQTRSLH